MLRKVLKGGPFSLENRSLDGEDRSVQSGAQGKGIQHPPLAAWF